MRPDIRHSRLVGTLADLMRNRHDLHMHCLVCDTSRCWAYDWLGERLPVDFTLSEWSARYRCPGCGRVGVSDLRISVRRPEDIVGHLADWTGEKGTVGMCNRYRAAIRKLGLGNEVFGFEEFSETDIEIFPDRPAPIVRMIDGIPTWRRMRWGLPAPQGDQPITNVRNLASPWWQRWLGPANRCLVPFDRFAEYGPGPSPRKLVWFRVTEDQPVAFAGIWRGWEGTRGPKSAPVTGYHDLFAFLTTEPNDLVGGVHEKAMPVILIGAQAMRDWLTAPASAVPALAAAIESEAMEIVGA